MASTTMALARAFTKRSKRHEPSTPARGLSIKHPNGYIDRNLISLPTELISTTNVHALNAPDIPTLRSKRSGSSGEGSDSDFSHIDRSFLLNTPTLSAETSSIDSSPITPITPHDNEIRDFFGATSKQSSATLSTELHGNSWFVDAPDVPKRALSHSKKAHVELSRKKSIQRMSPPPLSINRPSSRTAREDAEHPFQKELAQVHEVAEEFGVSSSVLDAEEKEMMQKGLLKFCAQDYLNEIADLWGGVFENKLNNPWL